jgi:hypothetical protein
MNPEYLRVEGHLNLLRDPNTNSIVNLDMSEYQQYIARKNVKSEENKKIQNLEDDVANIKGDLDEIKSLLRSLVNGS